jgi:hypothetical protein
VVRVVLLVTLVFARAAAADPIRDVGTLAERDASGMWLTQTNDNDKSSRPHAASATIAIAGASAVRDAVMDADRSYPSDEVPYWRP